MLNGTCNNFSKELQPNSQLAKTPCGLKSIRIIIIKTYTNILHAPVNLNISKEEVRKLLEISEETYGITQDPRNVFD